MTATTEEVGIASRTRKPVASALKARVWTLLHRHKLDLELAAGSDPNVDPLRRERARELVREGTRRRVADYLERVVVEAESAPRLRASRAPIARRAIRNSRSELETIVERLKAPAPVSPQGVAKALLLVTQGTGPLYGGNSKNSGQELNRALRAAVDAIDRGPGLTG